MRRRRPAINLPSMNRRGYAVWWDAGDGRHVGRLELGRLHVLFCGNGNGELALPVDQISAIEYTRGELLIHRGDERLLQVGSLDAAGALSECATRLAAHVAAGGCAAEPASR
jgi:hypothetical protein